MCPSPACKHHQGAAVDLSAVPCHAITVQADSCCGKSCQLDAHCCSNVLAVHHTSGGESASLSPGTSLRLAARLPPVRPAAAGPAAAVEPRRAGALGSRMPLQTASGGWGSGLTGDSSSACSVGHASWMPCTYIYIDEQKTDDARLFSMPCNNRAITVSLRTCAGICGCGLMRWLQCRLLQGCCVYAYGHHDRESGIELRALCTGEVL